MENNYLDTCAKLLFEDSDYKIVADRYLLVYSGKIRNIKYGYLYDSEGNKLIDKEIVYAVPMIADFKISDYILIIPLDQYKWMIDKTTSAVDNLGMWKAIVISDTLEIGKFGFTSLADKLSFKLQFKGKTYKAMWENKILDRMIN